MRTNFKPRLIKTETGWKCILFSVNFYPECHGHGKTPYRAYKHALNKRYGEY